MSAKITLSGMDRLNDMLVSGGSNAIKALARGLYEEGQIIFAKSQTQVPVDTGVLRASGMLHHPQVIGSEVVVEITYGGAASSYAEEQHENLKFRHSPPQKAKYLEDPVKDASDDFDTKLASRIASILKGTL